MLACLARGTGSNPVETATWPLSCYNESVATAAQNTRYRQRVRDAIQDYKASFGGCVDCGRNDLPLEVYELDHVRGEKLFGCSSASQYSLPAMLAELAKCDLRCPTCHALRHYHET